MANNPTPVDLNYASPPEPRPRRRFAVKFGWAIFIGAAVVFFLLMRKAPTTFTTVSLTQLDRDLAAGMVDSVSVAESELTYVKMQTITTGNTSKTQFGGAYRVSLPQEMGKDWRFVHYLMEPHNGLIANVVFENENNLVVSLLLPLVPWMLIFGFVWFFVVRPMKINRAIAPKPLPVVVVNPEVLK